MAKSSIKLLKAGLPLCILFTSETTMSDDEINLTHRLRDEGFQVGFRNAVFDDGFNIEDCDAVAGAVPERYNDVEYVKAALRNITNARSTEIEIIGDEPAKKGRRKVTAPQSWAPPATK